jgi:hypothetical protein
MAAMAMAVPAVFFIERVIITSAETVLHSYYIITNTTLITYNTPMEDYYIRPTWPAWPVRQLQKS